jgi:hypothetical protein
MRHHSRAWGRCIHSPPHTLFPSPPARDNHLWDCPTLFFPNVWSSCAAPLTGVAHPLRAPLSSPSHSSLPGTPQPSSAGFRPHLSAPAPPYIPSQVYTTTGRHGCSFSQACHSLPPRSLRRLRRHPTPSLHPPLSGNTTRSLSVVCSICSIGCHLPASVSSPHPMLRRSSWYSDSGAPRFRLSRTIDPMRITSGVRMRQSLPSDPFSASPRAATILAASGSKNGMRRTPDMHPHSLFPSPTPIVSLPPRRSSASPQARHNSPTRTSMLSGCTARSSGIRGRAVRPSSARDRRAHAAGDTQQWAPAAIAGTGACVGDSSNALSAVFLDTLTFFTYFLVLLLDVALSHSYLLCSPL